MRRLVYDIETNGLLPTLDTIHCIVAKDIDTQEVFVFSPFHKTIQEGIDLLEASTQVIGFNSVDFDNEACRKLYPVKFPDRIPWQENLDLMLLARLRTPDTFGQDYNNSNFPRNLLGRHSLEAWGHRLGVYKGAYGKTTDWSVCTPEMVEYCIQDVEVTYALYKYLRPNDYSSEAIQIEHDVRRYASWQEREGVPFDTDAARKLYKSIKSEYDSKWESVKHMFPDKVIETSWIPKVNSTKFGYKKGEVTIKKEVIHFNPGSRQQLIDFFKEKYQWEPVSFTDKGNPEIGYEVLEKLEYPEAKVIAELFDMQKLLGTLYDGDNGWLKLVKDGRIHGGIITNGCVSGRAAHFKPNLGNIPNETAYKGKECRELFRSHHPDWRFVGGDAAAIQVRILAHYLHYWDGGEYGHEAVNGDIHTKNMKAFGLTHRGTAKTVFFAMIFGAGAAKLGRTVEPNASKSRAEDIGREIINNFKRNIPAYNELLTAVKSKLRSNGHLVGLDGRKLIPRSQHAGLCTMVQGGEAVVMKKAIALMHKEIQERQLNTFPVLFVHDELELVAHKDHAEEVAKLIPESIRAAGEHFKLKVPMDGTGKVGLSWYDTH